MKNRNSKSSGIFRVITANIGTIIFSAFFIYIILSIALFLAAAHTTSYQVTAGPLAKNQTYTGLVLREETVIAADAPGMVTYYASESTRVRKKGPVYSVHAGVQDMNEYVRHGSLRSSGPEIRSLLGGFDPQDFVEIYALKSRLEYALIASAADGSGLLINNMTNAAGDPVKQAPADGIVSYIIDGYEDFDVAELGRSTFTERRERTEEVRPGDSVTTGQSIYKLVTSESWRILIPLTAKQVVNLEARTRVRVKFLKDGMTQAADFSVISANDGSFYGQLHFSSGMLRYLGDRFLRIELVTNTETGLKVPLTSLTKRKFLEIPESYMTKRDDDNALGIMKVLPDENGRDTLKFFKASVCGYANGIYYIDMENFALGDRIAEPKTDGQKMILSRTGSLDGVYSINKGYAIFRRVEILDKNEDYCIVKKGTRYGIAQFDFIVLDASGIRENEITAT